MSIQNSLSEASESSSYVLSQRWNLHLDLKSDGDVSLTAKESPVMEEEGLLSATRDADQVIYKHLSTLLNSLKTKSEKKKLKIKKGEVELTSRKRDNVTKTGTSKSSHKALMTIFEEINRLRIHQNIEIRDINALFDTIPKNIWAQAVLSRNEDAQKKLLELKILIRTKLFIAKLDEQMLLENENVNKLKSKLSIEITQNLSSQHSKDLTVEIYNTNSLIDKLKNLKTLLESMNDSDILTLMSIQKIEWITQATCTIDSIIHESQQYRIKFKNYALGMIQQSGLDDIKRSELTLLLVDSLLICKHAFEEALKRKEDLVLWGLLESSDLSSPVTDLHMTSKVIAPLRKITNDVFPNFIEKFHKEVITPLKKPIPDELHGAYVRRGSNPQLYMALAQNFLCNYNS